MFIATAALIAAAIVSASPLAHVATPTPPAGCVSGDRGELGEDHSVVRCAPLLVVADGTVSEGTWQCLLSAGYRGRQDDHQEALYAPAAAIRECLPRPA